jgi:hypothetical protein
VTSEELFVRWFMFLFMLYGLPLIVLLVANASGSPRPADPERSHPAAHGPKSIGDYWPE